MPIALYMDHHVPRSITDGLRLRGVDWGMYPGSGTDRNSGYPRRFGECGTVFTALVMSYSRGEYQEATFIVNLPRRVQGFL